MTVRSFLILHGLNGSSLGHWQTFLANDLRACGQQVIYPELPDKEQPDMRRWLAELKTLLREVPEDRDLTVVCHSLSCILWFHYAAEAPVRAVQRLVLVAPPGPAVIHEARPTFDPVPLDPVRLAASARERLLICTDADPRCVEKAADCYGRPLGIEVVRLRDEAQHINLASGYGHWPAMRALCLSDGLSVRFFQPEASADASST